MIKVQTEDGRWLWSYTISNGAVRVFNEKGTFKHAIERALDLFEAIEDDLAHGFTLSYVDK